MKSNYDVIVVGAGPAGSTAALHAAKGGASVLLLEKDREVGIPVRCAEGVGHAGLASVVDVNPRWIAQKITGAMLISPSRKEILVNSNEIGYVLNRKIFDYDLAQMAAHEGAKVLTKAYVYDLLFSDGYVSGVKMKYLGKDYSIKAKLVIGADGVESRVGRWAGLKTRTGMRDMETCAQVTAANINIRQDVCHFYFSRQIAPGGYLWIFPKGDCVANIGLGISGEFSGAKPVIDLLHEFIDAHFPQAAILTTVVGGVPCSAELPRLVANGLLLVGDAAHQTVPLSGGGIVTGMIAAKIAGQIAAEAVADNDTSAKRLSAYEKRWNKAEGKKQKLFYKLKNFVYSLTDKDLDRIADLLDKVPAEKRTILNIFKTALINQPTLILDAIKVFT
jgi:digeranylgeranylglycerophospholipid reductase